MVLGPLRVMVGPGSTWTLAVVSGMPVPLTWMTAVPGATLVTGTVLLDKPAPIVKLAGTVATVVSLELSFSVMPPDGAGEESATVRLDWLPLPVMVKFVGTNATE